VITGPQLALICQAAQTAAAHTARPAGAGTGTADHLGSLSGAMCDPDLTDSRDGHDLAAHIDTAIRTGRAADAVLHAITTAETTHVHADIDDHTPTPSPCTTHPQPHAPPCTLICRRSQAFRKVEPT
jgi:hypothetical protein